MVQKSWLLLFLCFGWVMHGLGLPPHIGPSSPDDLQIICAVQGSGFTSPFEHQVVTLRGVVYADLDLTSWKGFFIQNEDCDNDPSTSDGIFVYLGQKIDLVTSGDWVEVTGAVQEYYGMTEIVSSASQISLLSPGHLLPAPVELNPPFQPNLARAYFESLEGMYVSMDQAQVVGPTDADSRTWLVNARLGISRVFQDDATGTGEVTCVDDRGLFKITPDVKVGDRIQSLSGALDYDYGLYCLELVAAPAVIPAQTAIQSLGSGSLSSSEVFSFTVATFNLSNLFDTVDDPATEDDILSPTEYQRRLQKRALAIHDGLAEPDLLAVQEAENLGVLQELAARPELLADYGAILLEGVDKRGLDVGLLYRTDRVQVLDSQACQGCTTLVDGLGPDGNLDPLYPQNNITCDSDGDNIPDGNRLSSRPPLVVHLRLCQSGCLQSSRKESIAGEMVDIILIINHWKSKTEDTATNQYTLPRRLLEADFVGGLAQEILASDPGVNLIVLGDMNDFPYSPPLSLLASRGLENLLFQVAQPSRYSYNYQGISQVLDNILVHLQPSLAANVFSVVHINSDFPYQFNKDGSTFHRSSDHDPVIVQFSQSFLPVYLPLVTR